MVSTGRQVRHGLTPEFCSFISLRTDAKNVTIAPMKLALAALVYLVIALVLGLGILLLVAGKPWPLIIAFLLYVAAFGRTCWQPH